MTRDEIVDWMSVYNEEALLADGLEDAFIGMCEVAGRPPIALYDEEKCIEILAKQMVPFDDDEDDPYTMAVEYFEFNTKGAWVGENSPRYVTLYKREEQPDLGQP